MTSAFGIRVQGVVQGVGFRPFVYRLACAHNLCGWVLNREIGVEIHVEGSEKSLQAFIAALERQAPAAAQITSVDVRQTERAGFSDFVIRASERSGPPSARISPDLPVCSDCLAELFDPKDPRHLYPYINCTNCGPRFSLIESLPYDRPNTTMEHWRMDAFCAAQYDDPLDRRFHAQPVACPHCGPHYVLEYSGDTITGDQASIAAAVELLRLGNVVAVKGIGGYHLACDARNHEAVGALRYRKFRKEKPFAVMVKDIHVARALVDLSPVSEELLGSQARPIVLEEAKVELPGVAPGNHELGVMLPYAPLHHLLFAQGAPDILVMTSANRSSEPIAYRDEDAREQLANLADAYLVGQRPIARRVDDSVARAGTFGPIILRRSRGYAPGAVTVFPDTQPILAVGADLKNTITLVVDGQAFVSQHTGDLDHYDSFAAFQEIIADFTTMYGIDWNNLSVAHDAHPEYASTQYALDLPACAKHAVQHHRAHVASVIAERQAWDQRAVGISFDGTGYGDDGAIWGGEFFTGSLALGWTRALHLRNAALPGGDAAARCPVACAAGFLYEIEDSSKLLDAPFLFPRSYLSSLQLIERQVRTFRTSSVGRFFDAVAALLGFTQDITFEGQAAIWLEQLAHASGPVDPYPFPLTGDTLDFWPLLSAVIRDVKKGTDRATIARAFHAAVARTTWQAAQQLCETNTIEVVVLSGGVFQNELLLSEIARCAENSPLRIWTNRAVPPNDGGISLGQAASIALSAAQPSLEN